MNIFVDANSLIALAKSGTESNQFAGLDALLDSGNTIIISDTVYGEATSGAFPDASLIKQWVSQNGLTIETTSVGVSTAANAGELSIVELVNSSQFSGSPYSVLSDDAGFNWVSNGVPSVNVQGTVQSLNGFYNSGSLSADDYAAIRDATNTNAATTPSTDQFYSDETLGVTPELDANGNIVYGELTATPVDLNGTGLSPTGTTPDQAIDNSAGDLSSTLTTDGLSGNANLTLSALKGVGKVLGAAGLAGTTYDGFTTGQIAAQQVEAGNVTGAAQTVANFEARVFLALEGAEVAGTAGAEAGAGIGFFIGGPPGAAIGAAAGGLIGSVAGAVIGLTGAQALSALENKLSSFMQSLSGAATTAGVSTDGTYSAGINNAGGGSVVTAYNAGGSSITNIYTDPDGTGTVSSETVVMGVGSTYNMAVQLSSIYGSSGDRVGGFGGS